MLEGLFIEFYLCIYWVGYYWRQHFSMFWRRISNPQFATYHHGQEQARVVHPLVSNDILPFMLWLGHFFFPWVSLNLNSTWWTNMGVGKEPSSWAIHQQQRRERRGPLSWDSCHKWLAFFVLLLHHDDGSKTLQ